MLFLILILLFNTVQPAATLALQIQTPQADYSKITPLTSVDSSEKTILSEVSEINTTPKTQTHKDPAIKRTLFSNTVTNSDGTKTSTFSTTQLNYQKDGKMLPIINSVVAQADNPLYKKQLTPLEKRQLGNEFLELNKPTSYKAHAGAIEAEMRPFNYGLKIKAGEVDFIMKPIGSNNAYPEKTSTRVTTYKNAWTGVDVKYEVRGQALKESIILNSNKAQTTFQFEIKNRRVMPHPSKEGELAIDGLNPDEFSFSSLTLETKDKGIIDANQILKQTATDRGIEISLDKEWLSQQPTSAFPIIIDPTFYSDPPGGDMKIFKSDGYSCSGTVCHLNTGTLWSGGWKSWRSYFYFNYSSLANKRILNATVDMSMAPNKGGTNANKWMALTRANCLGYECLNYNQGVETMAGTSAHFNITPLMQNLIAENNLWSWFGVRGEEANHNSFKPFLNSVVNITYDTPAPIAQPASPQHQQVMVTTRPSLLVNHISDQDGDHVQYYFRVATSSNAENGAVINSGWINSNQWTIPGGVLQDGTTYYWKVFTRGGAYETAPNWVRSFKVDLRTGKDNTQTYDDLGPIGTNLATGNASLRMSSHAMSSLGGSIGLSLDYNTPNMSKKGVKAEYWNVPAGQAFSNQAPSSQPVLTRYEANVNNSWKLGSPGAGVNDDWFYARYSGYFVAPKTGDYYFGTVQDDQVSIIVNGNQVLNSTHVNNPDPFAGAAPIHLTAGQITPITLNFLEAAGQANVVLYVKGPIESQIIPNDWLFAEAINEVSQNGLTGSYYTLSLDLNIDNAIKDPSRLMLKRLDTNLNFNWNIEQGPAPGMAVDFMTRWTGYLTVPETGVYHIGAYSDDGIKIKTGTGLFGATQTILDKWTNGCCQTFWSQAINLTANKPIPITIDWHDLWGNGSMQLKVRLADGTEQAMPVKWLTPQAQALPSSWQLGIDIDGNVHYERLRASGESAILEDSSGSTHEYKWTGSGYKPPINEDGFLTKNADNSFTMIDSDGRTYEFNQEGSLTSLTTPSDDRQPASLKYEYANNPSRLVKISDGVTSSRFGTLHYANINEDGLCNTAAGFDNAPTGMLCAFRTSDGNITKFHYKNELLARIELPGNQFTDYAYDNFGRITQIRDALANDLIANNIRPNNDQLLTLLEYNQLGQIQSVKSPTPTAEGARISHSVKYLPIVNSKGGASLHIDGASEPHGFSKQIEYDHLYRTTKITDLTNQSLTQEWHPEKDLLLSSTSATGLKSTTLYDDDDKPYENYGPAPKEWFGNDYRPLSNKNAQVPHSSTKYNEGLKGLAVSYYAGRESGTGSNKVRTLVNPSKLNKIGFNSNNPASMLSYWDYFDPIDLQASDSGWGYRATGKLRVPNTANYHFSFGYFDGLIFNIDDESLVNEWNNTGWKVSTATKFLEAGKTYRISINYYTVNDKVCSHIFMMAPNRPPSRDLGEYDWSNYITPNYNLTTSVKVYDSQLGDNEVKTIYKNPTYDIIDRTILDPTGLNYENKATYEEPSAGLLRQTSKTLPGGTTTQYLHYDKNETRDNPCTPEVEAHPQAGRAKGKIEADPDGDGPQLARTSETIYSHAGQVVATRYNSDPWTCISYDERGRATTTIIPNRTENGVTIAGRVIANNYSVNNNPLITSSSDSAGTITSEIDLLGRTVRYVDANNNQTTTSYDQFGKVTSRTSGLGVETFTYDQYDRPITYSLDSNQLAQVSYDEFSRVSGVVYGDGVKLSNISRDELGREVGLAYGFMGDKVISDSVERYVSGDIKQGVENGVSKAYTYDKAGRLTSAQIGNNSFVYEFAQNAVCNITGNNPNSHKNGNRSKLVINGQEITFCYDYADRLIGSSDPTLGTPTYDSHGSTLSLGVEDGMITNIPITRTNFRYDASDRNIAVLAGNKETRYVRDVAGRISKKQVYENGAIISEENYAFSDTSDTPDIVKNNAGEIVTKYISLPGGVLLTLRPNTQSAGSKTYSLPNLHGDIMSAINADGALISNFMTGPFGEVLPNVITQPSYAVDNEDTPGNAGGNASYSYVGKHQKETDYTSPIVGGIIQMGARIYIPILGRFLQVDPIEGGTDNNYVYATDPVNEFDLSGEGIFRDIIKAAANWIAQNATTITWVGIGLSLSACIIATAGICSAVGAAVSASGGVVTASESYSKGEGAWTAITKGVVSTAIDVAIGFVPFFRPKAVRDFGKVNKTVNGVKKTIQRNYKSMSTAFTKIPAKNRLVRNFLLIPTTNILSNNISSNLDNIFTINNRIKINNFRNGMCYAIY